MYRGIESTYGDIYQFVDGININDLQAWVALNANDYASNVFASPYKELGYLNAPASEYIKRNGLRQSVPVRRISDRDWRRSIYLLCGLLLPKTQDKELLVLVGTGRWCAAGLSFWGCTRLVAATVISAGGFLENLFRGSGETSPR